ncbi:site-specific integrase [Streptomyces sp. VRA16 Mangrove soil]|uniref:tyrosine-type recombinase/integrase n=1 Tax=Streptomyces sp. VRA16 Mangrove soil TaxID=2817434 RepID=UPI001A9D48E9|nr:site-specific integrase [Streptomyces sp. VRA16 Mangrove soil]MBO1333628.1 site-specific integrase [Streptomyces sp. VRA16 Mangrove soil]
MQEGAPTTRINPAVEQGWMTPSERSFADCWEEWLAFGTREVSSVSQYRSIYRCHFSGWFGWKPVSAITAQDIELWEDDQKRRGYAEMGVRGRKVVLKSFLRYCCETGAITAYPGKEIKVSGRKEAAYRAVRPTEVPTTAEVMAIYAAMWPHYKSTVWIQAGCGLRVGEALAFSESHLGRREGWYFVQNQLTTFGANEGANRGVAIKNEPKWSRSGRWVPVPPSVTEVLELHRESWQPWGEEGWFYESAVYSGRHPSRTHYSDRWKQAVDKAGLADRGYTAKSLRHYFVSMALAAGVPLFEVSRWLGHTSTKVTEQVYAHLVEEAAPRITDAFEGALVRSLKAYLRVVS